MIRSFSVGPIGENVHIIEGDGLPVVVVDPGAEPERLTRETIAAVDGTSAPSVYIAMTHGHLDHVAALPGLLAGLHAVLDTRHIAVRTFAPQEDEYYYGDKSSETNIRIFTSIHGMSFYHKYWLPIPMADVYFIDGFILPGTGIVALHTPGHTRGSSCFLAESGTVLIAGDTLFKDGRGRTDNFDADEDTIIRSIRERLCVLPDDVRVLPGHGAPTTIGQEKRYYLN